MKRHEYTFGKGLINEFQQIDLPLLWADPALIDSGKAKKVKSSNPGPKQFDIYPSIGMNIIHVEAVGHHSVAIYNSVGQLMNHYMFTHRIEMDISDYPSDSYSVQLDRNSSKVSFKFVNSSIDLFQ